MAWTRHHIGPSESRAVLFVSEALTLAGGDQTSSSVNIAGATHVCWGISETTTMTHGANPADIDFEVQAPTELAGYPHTTASQAWLTLQGAGIAQGATTNNTWDLNAHRHGVLVGISTMDDLTGGNGIIQGPVRVNITDNDASAGVLRIYLFCRF